MNGGKEQLEAQEGEPYLPRKWLVPNSEVIWGLPKYGNLKPHRAWLQESSGLCAHHNDSGGGSLSQALVKKLGRSAFSLSAGCFLGLGAEQPQEGTLETAK